MMNKLVKHLLLLLLLQGYCSLCFATLNVGIGRKVITPQEPMWMTGYAGRDKPSTGKVHDLWAKAIVIQENQSNKVIIVTTDLLGLSHEVVESVADTIIKKYGINRSQLLMNASHTHSGPMVWPNLGGIASYTPEQQQIVSRYSQQLAQDITGAIDQALNNMQPMVITTGHGSAYFAVNRRVHTDKGMVIGVNKDGPVDHDVPVIKFTTHDGAIKAVLFGYACHNTTVPGDNLLMNGDYAGFAQAELEKTYPGATAMFIMGCAGDQNPNPRGTIAWAEMHGKELAAAVVKVLSTKLSPVGSTVKTAYETTLLDVKPYDIATYQKDVTGANVYLQRRAKLMLEAYNKGWSVNAFPYRVQAVRLGKDITILALGGEVVVDYSLMTKRKYQNENLFVAGYCNEVTCYIPNKRILAEGGYEAEDNMIYYSMAGPFADSIEDRIVKLISVAMKDVGVKPTSK